MITNYPYYWRWLKSLPHSATRRITRRKCRGYQLVEPFLRGKWGLEIGGPTRMFGANKLIPIYGCCQAIDNCNFSSQTIWAQSGEKRGLRQRGRQYIAEAHDLAAIPDGTYDFVAACHVLEHLANPLRAMQEWKRVLSPAGVILLVVPDKRTTFDHRRPYTTFDHIEADFLADTAESDLTHLDEILALHDLRADAPGMSQPQFRDRCLANPRIRAMHHHVFSPPVLVQMFSYLGLRVLNIAVERPEHVIGFAQNADLRHRAETRSHNLDFLSGSADWRTHDPLPAAESISP